jgi:hypothetical protein
MEGLKSIAFVSSEDARTKPPPDAREREALRSRIVALRNDLIAYLSGTPRELLHWNEATLARKGLDAAEALLGESSYERRIRLLQEDRAKGGLSWWATFTLIRAVELLGHELSPLELHILAVWAGKWHETVDMEKLLKDGAAWRQMHSRCTRYAAELRASATDSRSPEA